jgi:hypothetical protein
MGRTLLSSRVQVQSRLRDADQNVTTITDATSWLLQTGVGEEERAMAIDENGLRLASNGAPLGKKRLSENWRIIEYRVLSEPRGQSFERVFRFDKEAKPMRWF